MPARARLETTLTANDAPFVAAVNRAEARAKTFAGKVENFLQFRGERRVARGTGLLGQQLLQAQSGVDALEASVYGLASVFKIGFGATIGIIAGVAIFKKFQEQIDATTAAEQRLNKELATMGGTRGPEEIQKKFEAVAASTENLIEKSQSLGTQTANFLDRYVNPFVGTRSKHKTENLENEVASGLTGQGQLMQDRVEAEEEVVKIRRKGLNVSEREAAIDKIALEGRIKRSSINEEATEYKLRLFEATRKGLLKPHERDTLIQTSEETKERRKENVDTDTSLSMLAVDRRLDLKRQEEVVENRILNLHASSLTKEQQSIQALRERINLLKTRLAGPGTEEQKTQIGTQLHGLENQEAMARYQEYLKPQKQKDAEREAQRAYQRWTERDAKSEGLTNVHRDINGNIIGGTDPITGARVNKTRVSALDMPIQSAFRDDSSLKNSSSGHVGDVVGKLDAILTEIKKWGD